MGLVNAVVARRGARCRGRPVVHEILQRSPQGLRLAKLALNSATDLLHGAVQHGLELVALNHVHAPSRRRASPPSRRSASPTGASSV